jgi:hypothetical protein
VLMPIGLAKVQEVGWLRSVLVCAAVGVLFGAACYSIVA